MLVIFLVLRAQDTELEFGVRVADDRPFIAGVEIVHQLFCALEGPVDDVDVVDFGPPQQ